MIIIISNHPNMQIIPSLEIDGLLENQYFSTLSRLVLIGDIKISDILVSTELFRIIFNEPLFQLVQNEITPKLASEILNNFVIYHGLEHVNADNKKAIYYKHFKILLDMGGKISIENHDMMQTDLFSEYLQLYPYSKNDLLFFLHSDYHLSLKKINILCKNYPIDDYDFIIKIFLANHNPHIIFSFLQHNLIFYDKLNHLIACFLLIKFCNNNIFDEHIYKKPYDIFINLIKRLDKSLDENPFIMCEIWLRIYISMQHGHRMSDEMILSQKASRHSDGHNVNIRDYPNYDQFELLVKKMPDNNDITYEFIINYFDELFSLMPPIMKYITEKIEAIDI